MAGSANDIRAGKAFVELYLKNNLFTKGLQASMKALKDFGGKMMAVGKGMMNVGSRMAITGGIMASAFIAPIKAASDLMETTSKFGAVFGDQAAGAKTWMENFARDVGRGKKEAMDGLSAFQAFFTGMGMGGEEAAEMSKKLTALAVDFGSFHNVSDKESMERFISALSGSSQVLDMFGINIKQSALDMKLLEMGFPSIAKGADEMQKVMARTAIITEAMGRQGAVGDAVRTAGSFSNQLKALRGSLMDTAAAIGSALLPVLTPLVAWASKTAKIFGEWVANNSGVIRAVFKIAAGVAAAGAAIFGMGTLLTTVGGILTGIATIAGTVGAAISSAMAIVLNPITLTVAALATAGVAWLRYSKTGQSVMANVADAVRRGVKATLDYFAPFVETITNSWSAVVKAIKAGDLVSAGKVVMAAFAEIFARIKLNALMVWNDVKGYAMDTFDEMRVQAQGATAFIGTLFNAWAREVQAIWQEVVLQFEEGWRKFENLGSEAMSALGLDFKGLVNMVAMFDSRLQLALAGFDVAKAMATGGDDAARAAAAQAAKAAEMANNAFKAKGLDFGAMLEEANAARDKAIERGRGENIGLKMEREAAGANAIDNAAAAALEAKRNLDKAIDIANNGNPEDIGLRMEREANAAFARDQQAAKDNAAARSAAIKALEAKHLGKGREIVEADIQGDAGAEQIRRRANFGSFSAAALMAGARGGNPNKGVEDAIKAQQKAVVAKIDKQIEATDKMRRAFNGIQVVG